MSIEKLQAAHIAACKLAKELAEVEGMDVEVQLVKDIATSLRFKMLPINRESDVNAAHN